MRGPVARIAFDGERLDSGRDGSGRRLLLDARCLRGEPVRGAFAHVCALPDADAVVRFDEPEVQEARRDALAWWIPLLGGDLICLSTLAVDGSLCAGALTVARSPAQFDSDPFARLFPGTLVRTDLFCPAPAPAGPVIERYAGSPWPAGAFR
jgi:hypothetical protein